MSDVKTIPAGSVQALRAAGVYTASPEADDMARRRLQSRGHLFRDGRWWRLRWREDGVNERGEVVRFRPSAIVGPCQGPGALSEKQAKRLAWDTVLSKLDAFTQCPGAMMTLAQFVTQKFEPEVVWTLKHAGKLHYGYCLKKILPRFGSSELRNIRATEIQLFIRQLIDAGLSIQTATHMKNAMHAVFSHAKSCSCYAGENPASLVRLPEMTRRERGALSWEQGNRALELLPLEVRLMALLSMTTSMNVAELCGLRWKRVNLTEEFLISGGEAIPPLSVAVRENYYRNRYGTVKAGRRNRTLPIPLPVIAMLRDLARRGRFVGPDDVVFAGRTGRPIDAHNTNSRVFKRISKALGVTITWHVFRHSCATFAETIGMPKSDRMALIGHGTGSMTDHYTHADVDRMRAGVDLMAQKLMPNWTAAGQEPMWKQ